MKNTVKFTVYMTEGERLALRLLARHFGLSENAVMKILLRDKVGLPIGEQDRELLNELTNSPVHFS